jgi:hypothetical protein
MNNPAITFENITPATLSEITGGVKWGQAFDKAFEWSGRAGTVGTIGGAGVGSLIPGVGTLTGAGIGGVGGTAGGFAAGLAKGIYDTWGQ